MSRQTLTDDEYGRVLDNIVVGCVDVAVTHKGTILLEKRVSKPIQGEWWIFGGRMQFGETFKETARRGVYRELGIDIQDTDRFNEIGIFNLRWPDRREPISENGCHHLLVAHSIEISDIEKEAIDGLIDKRNVDARWIDMKGHNLYLLDEVESIIKQLAKA